jgi:hypothetical protein
VYLLLILLMLDGVYLYNISIKEVNLEGAAQPALVRPVYPKPRERGMGSEGKDTGES